MNAESLNVNIYYNLFILVSQTHFKSHGTRHTHIVEMLLKISVIQPLNLTCLLVMDPDDIPLMPNMSATWVRLSTMELGTLTLPV